MQPGDRVLALRYIGSWQEATYLGRAPTTETRPTTRGRTTRMLGWRVRWLDGSEHIVRGAEGQDQPIKPMDAAGG